MGEGGDRANSMTPLNLLTAFQGRHEWGKVGDRANSMTCPICITNSPTVKLLMGVEPAFYVDSGRGLTSFAKPISVHMLK